MCGIAGIVHRDASPVDPGQIDKMLDTIRHRGPDDRGTFFDGAIALGHQRLSIIDIEGGHQPMAFADGQFQIIYNGELYNFQELRAALLKLGVQFRTRSDTEVILAAYATWGVSCFKKFNGIFAFALWDRRSRRLLLVRDGAGVKPLYYYIDDRKLVFASEIKALLVVPGIPRTLDTEALDAYLDFRYVPSPSTLLKGICKLPPFQVLVIDESGISQECYSDPQAPQQPWSDEGLLREEILSRLEDSVERQMVSDVDVGLLLSGGVDSSALLSLMGRHTRRPVETFTVGFQGDHAENETEEARRVAEHFGANHHEILMDAVDYRDTLPTVVRQLEEPLCTPSIIPFFFLTRLAGDHVKVVLSGQGADEAFAGYTRYIGEKLGGPYRSIPSPVRHFLMKLVNRLPIQGETLRRGTRALGNEQIGRRFAESYAVYSEEERQALYGKDSGITAGDHSRLIDAVRKPVSDLRALDQMLFVDLRLWLPDDLLLYTDKLSMAHSLEVRVPFLDRDFLAFVESVPATWKLRGLRTKYILKEAVRPLLPPGVIDRKKKGLPTPMGRWLKGELTSYARDVLLASDSVIVELFDRSIVEGLISDHVRGFRNRERQIFTLLALEIWHRTFLRSASI